MSLLHPVRDTLATSAGLARERLRTGGVRSLLFAWIVQAAVLLVVGSLVPGVLVEGVLTALLAALVLGLLNALVRPVLVLLTLPLSVLTVGLTSLVINAVMLGIAAPFVPGLEVTSAASAFAAALVITVLTTMVSVALSSNQDESFYAELSRRLSTLDRPRIPGVRGLVVIQVDGLAAPILRSAIRVGLTPRMASWVRSGRYRLVEWDCAPPSQTSASQAGILHGNNTDIPAFRWYEKERGRLMVSNRPADAAEIERRISDGRGLLAGGGTSMGNLFSGDAPRTLLTMSTIQQPERAADVDAFSLYFVDPAALVRTVVLTVGEVVKELLEARRQRAMDIQPRVHRGATFSVLRAVSNVLLRDLNVTFLMNAIGRGIPIMYVDFVDYDELAHHAGPERLESLRSLAGVDRALASIERAIADAPRDYAIVVLSDHGQSQGATFLQRYGRSLEEVIRDLMGGAPTSMAITAEGEGWGPVNALLTEIRKRPGVAGRVTSSAFERRTVDGAVQLGKPAAAGAGVEPGGPAEGGAGAPELVVCASGNLANVYFTTSPDRLDLEAIDGRYSGLVERLAAHPGIGFVMVRTATLGPVAIGRSGVHHLADGHVDGEDPLSPFGPRTAEHLLRLDGFAHVGDLLVNSMYDAELEEVAAFEELVGSHGGFGGPQVRPFILAPADLPIDEASLIGAPAVYRQLVRWADSMGVGPGSGAVDAPTAVAAPLRKPRGIGVVAGLIALSGSVWFVIGALVLGADLIALGSAVLLVIGLVFLALGMVGFLVAWGLWRRRRWAWLTALVIEGIAVIQVLLVAAGGGLAGLGGIGITQVASALGIFFYLTRPHVAAAFGRQRRRRPTG